MTFLPGSTDMAESKRAHNHRGCTDRARWHTVCN